MTILTYMYFFPDFLVDVKPKMMVNCKLHAAILLIVTYIGTIKREYEG